MIIKTEKKSNQTLPNKQQVKISIAKLKQFHMIISTHNVEFIYLGSHSGATFAYCMRCMQAIAKDGFDEWSKKQNNVPN